MHTHRHTHILRRTLILHPRTYTYTHVHRDTTPCIQILQLHAYTHTLACTLTLKPRQCILIQSREYTQLRALNSTTVATFFGLNSTFPDKYTHIFARIYLKSSKRSIHSVCHSWHRTAEQSQLRSQALSSSEG